MNKLLVLPFSIASKRVQIGVPTALYFGDGSADVVRSRTEPDSKHKAADNSPRLRKFCTDPTLDTRNCIGGCQSSFHSEVPDGEGIVIGIGANERLE